MKATPVLAAAVIAVLVLMATACGGSTAPSGPQPTAGPTASGGGGGASPTAAPASAEGKAAPTAAPAAKPASTTPAKSASPGGGELVKVSMPSGPAFDPYKPVKIGDVVDLPRSSMVLQVTGARTVDYDPQNDFLLVDLIVGNKAKEKAAISSVLMMGAVTSEWRTYSLNVEGLMQAAAKIAALGIKTFDTELPPGEARKGTAVIPVPKDARGLGFLFHPMNTANIGESEPTVYVGLGVKGDFAFPIIPEDAPALKPGTLYKVGQPVKAPKRGVAIQVNGAKERTQSLPNLSINVAEKVVMVDITTRLFGAANGVATREVSLVDGAGKAFRPVDDSNVVVIAENGVSYSSSARRGLRVFMGPRDAKGLKLVFAPTSDEKVEFDLGTLAQSTSAPFSGTTTAPGKTATGPKLVDASVLPAEIKAIPLPAGFGVVEGSVNRSAPGGAFESADAQLSGKMTMKDLSSFYKMRLGAQWDLLDESVTAGELQLNFFNRKDDSLNLYINAEETDRGTTVDLRIEKS